MGHTLIYDIKRWQIGLKTYSIPMLNTTKIHVDAIVKYCVGQR